jgi:cell division protein FtsW
METKITNYIKNRLAGDYRIWLIVILLNTFGLLIQFSAKGKLSMDGPFEPIASIIKSLAILGFSFWLMAWTSQKNYIKLTRLAHIALVFSWILIVFALKFGESKGGASRWIELGPISFMPSDMAKLCLTASLAKIFSTRQTDPSAYNFTLFLIILAEIGITCFLIMLSNFSTSILIFTTSIVLMIFGRVPTAQITGIIAVVVSIAIIVVYFEIGQRASTVKARLKAYATRTLSTSTKEAEKIQDKGDSYQLKRSWYAIATGALIPKGPGNSQFRYLLSQAESDFIYAIILEEYGLTAGLAIPILFILFTWRGASAIKYSEKPLGGLLSAGLTFTIVLQAFVNMLVAVGAIPVTGQPMPMISAGGTSLIFTAISIGLILSISRDKVNKISELKPVI